MATTKTYLPAMHLACANYNCSNIPEREFLQYVHIVNNIAFSTNAHTIIVCDLLYYGLSTDLVDKLNGKSIHAPIWKELCKYESIDVKENFIAVDVTKNTFNYKIEFPVLIKENIKAGIQSCINVIKDMNKKSEQTTDFYFDPTQFEIIVNVFKSYFKRDIKLIVFNIDKSKPQIILPSEEQYIMAGLMRVAISSDLSHDLSPNTVISSFVNSIESKLS